MLQERQLEGDGGRTMTDGGERWGKREDRERRGLLLTTNGVNVLEHGRSVRPEIRTIKRGKLNISLPIDHFTGE